MHRVLAAILHHLAALVVAQMRVGGVVELDIAAAGIGESLDRLAIGEAKIVQHLLGRLVDAVLHRFAADAIMQNGRRRQRHLRRNLGIRLQKLEVIDHRRAGIADLAGDANILRPRFDAGELDAVRGAIELGAIKQLEEVELPPGAAKFAVGRKLQADLFLFLDDLLDLFVLHRLQSRGVDLALLAL